MAVFLDTCGQLRKAKHRKIQGKESVSSRQMLSLCFPQRNAFLLYVGSPLSSSWTTISAHMPWSLTLLPFFSLTSYAKKKRKEEKGKEEDPIHLWKYKQRTQDGCPFSEIIFVEWSRAMALTMAVWRDTHGVETGSPRVSLSSLVWRWGTREVTLAVSFTCPIHKHWTGH